MAPSSGEETRAKDIPRPKEEQPTSGDQPSKFQNVDDKEIPVSSKDKPSEHTFSDDSFPPSLSSLYDPSDCTDDAPTQFANLEWKRIPELYPNFVVLPDTLSESDILQGSVGDCYFVTCLAALAAKPERIRKLFKTLEPQRDGRYVV